MLYSEPHAARSMLAIRGAAAAGRRPFRSCSIAFLAAIGFFGYRLFHQFRFEIESLEDRDRAVLYGSIALAILTFAGARRMFDAGGGGTIAWLALVGISVYGLYWVWTRYRRLA